MALGQEVELVHHALHVALAPQFAGADGDARLQDVVARAQGVVTGVEEGEHALLLVVVHEHAPHEGGHTRHGQQAGAQHIAAQAVEQDHAAHDEQHHHGRAEVGLLEDEDHGHQAHGQHGKKALPAQGLAVAGQQARHQDEYGDLDGFRGLDGEQAEGYPALGAVKGGAHEGHQHQQHQEEQVGGPGQVAQLPVVEERGQQHAAQAAQAPDQLALVEALEGEARLHTGAAGGIEVGHAREVEQQHAGQQCPVDIAEKALVHGAFLLPSAATALGGIVAVVGHAR